MKLYLTFFRNAFVIGSIIIAIVYFLPKVFSPLISPSTNLVAATIDKENRLKSIRSPKIIIIGGSGSAFSIDSKMIEDSLKMPVVNMAVAYGLGLGYMLEEVKSQINEGDKILVVPEYYLPLAGNKKLITLLKDLNPEAQKYLKLGLLDQLELYMVNFQRVGSSLFYMMKTNFKPEDSNTRNSYNHFGDMVSHLNKPNQRPLKDQEILYKSLYTNEINHLNAFQKVVENKKANVIFSFPAYPDTEFKKNKEAILFLEYRLKNKYLGKLANRPQDNLYEEQAFFDTVYHLNAKARKLRTEYLIELLK